MQTKMQTSHKIPSWKHIALFLLATTFAPMVSFAAEKPTNLEPLEEAPPPPAIGNENDPDKPEITIIKKNEETIEEYRIGGELYMMKITPAHGTPYYMHKEDKGGAWIHDGPNAPLSVPKWTIFRF